MKKLRKKCWQTSGRVVLYLSCPARDGRRWKKLVKSFGSFKKISKKCLTKRTSRDIIKKLSRKGGATQDLENWTNLKLVEPYSVWKNTLINSKKTSNSTGRKRLCLRNYSDLTLCKWLNTIYKEFDPGSGRTLAARLTHASRTELERACFFKLSGERVSNAWVTCPGVGDNSWKRLLIPHKPTVPHGTAGKGFIRFRMDSRPIS